jgi:hypothetical protein
VFVFLAVLVLVSLAAVVLSIVEIKRDGYRRAPERPLVRIF